MKRVYLYRCPVCEKYIFEEGPHSYEICPICGWEDDLSQVVYPESSGANKESLNRYKEMWKAHEQE